MRNVITLTQNGQHLELSEADLEVFGDLTVPRIEALASPAHGYDVQRHRRSVLRSPEGFRIPNAGCLPLLAYRAAKLGFQVRLHQAPTIARLPEPAHQEDLVYPQLADFVRTYERGLIRVPEHFNDAVAIAELADAFPESNIVVLGAHLAELTELRRQLHAARKNAGFPETECEPIPIVYDRQRMTLNSDDEMPKLILSTFLGAGDLDLAVSDVVVLLNTGHCVHERAQRLLEQMDARFRLFGIARAGQKMSPSEAGVTMAVFGPEVLDLMPEGKTRRDVHVAWVRHNQQWIPGGQTLAAFQKKCVWRNDHRNRIVANLAEALVNGSTLVGKRFGEVPSGLGGRICGPQAVTVLVSNLDHARALSHHLNDWPLIVGRETDLSGLPGSFRNRVKRDRRRWLDGHRQIVLTEPAAMFDGQHADVIVWAGGSPHPPLIPEPWLGQRPGCNWPLLIVDFRDSYNTQARGWSRQRQKGYAAKDMFDVGVDPVIGRIRRFLQQQPGGRQ